MARFGLQAVRSVDGSSRPLPNDRDARAVRRHRRPLHAAAGLEGHGVVRHDAVRHRPRRGLAAGTRRVTEHRAGAGVAPAGARRRHRDGRAGGERGRAAARPRSAVRRDAAAAAAHCRASPARPLPPPAGALPLRARRVQGGLDPVRAGAVANRRAATDTPVLHLAGSYGGAGVRGGALGGRGRRPGRSCCSCSPSSFDARARRTGRTSAGRTATCPTRPPPTTPTPSSGRWSASRPASATPSSSATSCRPPRWSAQRQHGRRRHQRRRAGPAPALPPPRPALEPVRHAGEGAVPLLRVHPARRRRTRNVRLPRRPRRAEAVFRAEGAGAPCATRPFNAGCPADIQTHAPAAPSRHFSSPVR
jgi:hypothetical protein